MMTAVAYIVIFSTTATLHIIVLFFDSERSIDLDIVATCLVVYASFITGLYAAVFTPHKVGKRQKLVVYAWIGLLYTIITTVYPYTAFWRFYPGIEVCIAGVCENTCNSDKMHSSLARARQDDLEGFLPIKIQRTLPDFTKGATDPIDLAEQLLYYKGSLYAIGIDASTSR